MIDNNTLYHSKAIPKIVGDLIDSPSAASSYESSELNLMLMQADKKKKKKTQSYG